MKRNTAQKLIKLFGGALSVIGLFLVMFVLSCADSTGKETWVFLFKVLTIGIVFMAVGLPLYDRKRD